MKKTIICLACSVLLYFFTGCEKSNEQKAKNAVRKYLAQNMNDPKSYEEISWDSLRVDYKMGIDDTVRMYKDSSLRYDSIYNKYSNSLRLFRAALAAKDLSKEYKEMSDEYKEYKDSSIINGWSIIHKYRGKNSFGGLIVTEKEFHLSKNFDSVNYEPVIN